jgi:predicted SprT family Zn-dependent metalloprotease
VYQWPRGSCLMKKTRGQKSRVRVPLKIFIRYLFTSFISKDRDLCQFIKHYLLSIVIDLKMIEYLQNVGNSWKVITESVSGTKPVTAQIRDNISKDFNFQCYSCIVHTPPSTEYYFFSCENVYSQCNVCGNC